MKKLFVCLSLLFSSGLTHSVFADIVDGVWFNTDRLRWEYYWCDPKTTKYSQAKGPQIVDSFLPGLLSQGADGYVDGTKWSAGQEFKSVATFQYGGELGASAVIAQAANSISPNFKLSASQTSTQEVTWKLNGEYTTKFASGPKMCGLGAFQTSNWLGNLYGSWCYKWYWEFDPVKLLAFNALGLVNYVNGSLPAGAWIAVRLDGSGLKNAEVVNNTLTRQGATLYSAGWLLSTRPGSIEQGPLSASIEKSPIQYYGWPFFTESYYDRLPDLTKDKDGTVHLKDYPDNELAHNDCSFPTSTTYNGKKKIFSISFFKNDGYQYGYGSDDFELDGDPCKLTNIKITFKSSNTWWGNDGYSIKSGSAEMRFDWSTYRWRLVSCEFTAKRRNMDSAPVVTESVQKPYFSYKSRFNTLTYEQNRLLQ